MKKSRQQPLTHRAQYPLVRRRRVERLFARTAYMVLLRPDRETREPPQVLRMAPRPITSAGTAPSSNCRSGTPTSCLSNAPRDRATGPCYPPLTAGIFLLP